MIDNSTNNHTVLWKVRATINLDEFRGNLFTNRRTKYLLWRTSEILWRRHRFAKPLSRFIAILRRKRGSHEIYVADIFFFKYVDHVDPVLLGWINQVERERYRAHCIYTTIESDSRAFDAFKNSVTQRKCWQWRFALVTVIDELGSEGYLFVVSFVVSEEFSRVFPWIAYNINAPCTLQ